MPSLEQHESSPFLERPASAPSSPPATPLRDSLDRLEQAVSAIHDSDTFRRYLDSQARFHRYSWGNVLLIVSQYPSATRVAGFATWKSLGRSVRTGERGIRILVPIWLRHRDADDAREEGAASDDTLDRHGRRLAFKTGAVFDISQTGGAPLPEVKVPVLDGEQGRELLGHLEAVARREDLTVERATHGLGETTMGFYEPLSHRIVLRESSPLQMTKTLAHELAHHFGGASSSSSQEETLAESVAYVTCARFGVDTGARSFPYVATWGREPAMLRAVLARVQGLSATLIAELEAILLDGPASGKERCAPPSARTS